MELHVRNRIRKFIAEGDIQGIREHFSNLKTDQYEEISQVTEGINYSKFKKYMENIPSLKAHTEALYKEIKCGKDLNIE